MLTIIYFNRASSFSEADLEGSLFHPIFFQSFLPAGEPGFRRTLEFLDFSRIENGERILYGTVGNNLGRELADGDLLDASARISSWELRYGSSKVMRFDFDPDIRRDGDAANPGPFPMPIFGAFDAFGARIIGNDFDNYLGGRGAGDRLIGAGGDDRLEGVGGSDRLKGGDGDDVAFGGRGDDRAWGGDGRDLVICGDGDDVVRGGVGRDFLRGGGGNDRIYGGISMDTLSGGAGADVFVFTSARDAGRGPRGDVILDFERGLNKIDLRAIDADPQSSVGAFTFIGDAAFSGDAGELRYANGGLRGDVDGDGRADFRIEFADDARLTTADLLL